MNDHARREKMGELDDRIAELKERMKPLENEILNEGKKIVETTVAISEEFRRLKPFPMGRIRKVVSDLHNLDKVREKLSEYDDLSNQLTVVEKQLDELRGLRVR